MLSKVKKDTDTMSTTLLRFNKLAHEPHLKTLNILSSVRICLNLTCKSSQELSLIFRYYGFYLGGSPSRKGFFDIREEMFRSLTSNLALK